MFRKIFVVINPASGKPEPVLRVLHETFREREIGWDVSILQQSELAGTLDRAEQWGADLIAVYGGDGTVSSVAGEMVGRALPLAILPGGTANVLSEQLGIPGKLTEACGLLVDEQSRLRTIDLGRVNGRTFLCQVGIGFNSRILEETDDKSKSRFGVMAYITQGLKHLFGGEKIELDITVDGKQVQTEAFSCIVCNAGKMGMKVEMSPVDIADGLLDIFVIRDLGLKSLQAEVADDLQANPDASLVHWRGENIRLRSEPPESVEYDGEVFKDDSYSIEIVKQGLRVLVPPEES
jgi:YegS/Rv2252/BmrU family lipid kinase